MLLGRVFRRATQTTCLCLIQNEPETGEAPAPGEYAPGRFVRIEVLGREHHSSALTDATEKGSQTYLVGFVYNTLAARGGAKSAATGEIQTDPSALRSGRSAIIAIRVVGGVEKDNTPSVGTGLISVTQGKPPYSPAVGDPVEMMTDEQVRSFHSYAELGQDSTPYLHLDYIPLLLRERNPLLLLAAMQAVEHLECLFPANRQVLSIVKRSCTW